MVDVLYPDAERIVLMLDQLNTPPSASLYEVLPPVEDNCVAAKLELHYTPSTLNMAEVELNTLQRQCLARRLGDGATLRRDVAAWVTTRNAVATTTDWRFTTEDARIRLKRLNPAVHA